MPKKNQLKAKILVKAKPKKNGGKPEDYAILVVDDHPQTVVSITTVLDNEGFRTFQAYDGWEAIEISKAEKPDLIICDILMEGISGFQVAKALPNQIMMFLTPSEADELRKKEEQEAVKYKNALLILQKPVDTDKLLDVLRKLFKLPKRKTFW